MVDAKHCADCGKAFVAETHTPGYGTYGEDRICYACCALRDIADMKATGRAVLYLTDKGVTNWPGSLVFKPSIIRKMAHPFSRTARIAYFTGPDGANWSAKNIGDNDIAHCRRLAR